MPKASNGLGTIFRIKSGPQRGRYVAELTIGWHDGKRVRARHSSKLKRECQEWLRQAIQDRDHGLPVVPVKQSVTAFLKDWLEWKRERVRPNSYNAAESLLRNHAYEYFTYQPLGTLSGRDIDRWLDELADGGCSDSVRAQSFAFLRMALRQAVKWQLIPRDPCQAIDKAPTQQPRPGRAFSQEEAVKFTQAIKGDPLEALYLTTLSLGLRRGEALGLMWADLDERRSEIHIRRQLQLRKGVVGPEEPKTRSSARSVFVPPFLLAALQEHRKKQAGRSVYMFTAERRPLTPAMFSQRFLKVCKAAGIETTGLHDLRRTAASLLYAKGVDLLTISRILGHKSPTITARLYALTYEETSRDASSKMEDILGAG